MSPWEVHDTIGCSRSAARTLSRALREGRMHGANCRNRRGNDKLRYIRWQNRTVKTMRSCSMLSNPP